MLTDTPLIPKIMDNELIGFLTAVDPGGQPQTSPVWFVRDGDDIVVYNRADTRRLTSLGSNPKVAFNLRGDLRGRGAILIEGTASVENDLPAALDFAGYLDKYGREIERLGWTAHSFSNDYPTGVRITVTRVRSWGLETLDT